MTNQNRPRRWAKGLLGMVTLVVLIEVGIGKRPDLADPVALEWRYGAKAIPKKACDAAILCLGDSLIKFGIAPSTLEARLGRRVTLHAVPAASASASYFALRSAIDAGARPRVVVVDYAPFLLLPGYRLNHQFLPEVAGLRDCLDLAGWDRMASWAERWRWPGSSHRSGTATVCGPGWRSMSAGPRLIPRGPNGPTSGCPATTRRSLTGSIQPPWQPGADHRHYIERLLTLANDHGITVAWLMPPIGDPIRGEWDTLGLIDRYRAFVASVQTRFPDLVVLDAHDVPVPPADRLDPLHLNPAGAVAFTGSPGRVPRPRRTRPRPALDRPDDA